MKQSFRTALVMLSQSDDFHNLSGAVPRLNDLKSTQVCCCLIRDICILKATSGSVRENVRSLQ